MLLLLPDLFFRLLASSGKGGPGTFSADATVSSAGGCFVMPPPSPVFVASPPTVSLLFFFLLTSFTNLPLSLLLPALLAFDT